MSGVLAAIPLSNYAISGTITPSATANTNGAPFTLTPPAGYRFIWVVHIGLSNFGVATETITVTCTGTLLGGAQVSNNNTYTTNAGDMDNQHFLEPAWGISAASGQSNAIPTISVSMVEQSTIGSSAASATIRFWAIAVP